MCIIIDANVGSEIGGPKISADALPIREWIEKKAGQVAIGGRLTQELSRSGLRDLLLQLVRKGSAKIYSGDLVSAEEARLKARFTLRSDDEHIVALARVSGCRLVFTRDKALGKDVNDRSLLNGPRGKVYSSHKHRALLRTCPSCR